MRSLVEKGISIKIVGDNAPFTVPFSIGDINDSRIDIKLNLIQYSKEDMMAKAFIHHSKGEINQALEYYKMFVNHGFVDAQVFINYGILLKDLGKLKNAELYAKKAIDIKPNYLFAYSNLAIIQKKLGKLKDALNSLKKVLEINPNFTSIYSNLGILLKDMGRLKEAEKYTRLAIKNEPNMSELYSNLSTILLALGELEKAEESIQKAIKLNPNVAVYFLNLGSIKKAMSEFEEAEKYTLKAISLRPDYLFSFSNLAIILIDLGRLDEARTFLEKAIQINPSYAKAYYLLSTLKNTSNDHKLRKSLFSEKLFKNIKDNDKVDIYFARSNYLHRESKYLESSKYLILANEIKLVKRPSRKKALKKKAKYLLIQSDQEKSDIIKEKDYPVSIFIVGMPRCGSTLLENIISMNPSIKALGETNILHESFKTWKNSNKAKSQFSLASIFQKNVYTIADQFSIIIDKQLYNYQYTGFIANQIPNAKIIHCFRNPLDNILSIYRAHFANENSYASSLIDCAEVYLNQEEVMEEYKKRYRKMIYDFNYDLLVNEPLKEIQSLIQWLNLEWNDKYLSPQHNTRSVSTASYAQVRSPINNKSVGGWKNYREMMQPAIEVIMSCSKYKNLIS